MIITINREFGSGGRELGKRLADALHVPCYDHQIIEMIASEQGLNEEYVANVGEKCIESAYPLTISHRLAMMPLMMVAGDHAMNDMAGDEEDSFKSMLLKEGFKVDTYLHGLGENSAVQNLFVKKASQAWEALQAEK